MTLTEQVREHLEDCIYPVLAKAEVFASEIGVSVHTLRKKLRAEGTCWQDLYREEIRRRVWEMRKIGFKEKEIAEAVGYAFIQNLSLISGTRSSGTDRHTG